MTSLTMLRSICFYFFLSIVSAAYGTFYQADTMAQYCQEYIKLISLESNVNQYEAGTCFGYLSSKIEVMLLSEQLCHKEKLNLDNVVNEFISAVKNNDDLRQQSATYVVVQVLQDNYTCEE